MARPHSAGAFNKSQSVKAAKQAGRAISERLKQERSAAAAALREKREAKQKRRAENEIKGAQYQVIADPKKLKKMSKKQLRSVKRTTVDSKGNVKLVGAYT